jgi:hypothetical protein
MSNSQRDASPAFTGREQHRRSGKTTRRVAGGCPAAIAETVRTVFELRDIRNAIV